MIELEYTINHLLLSHTEFYRKALSDWKERWDRFEMCTMRQQSGDQNEGFRVSRISSEACSPSWAIAVFAHNEGERIRAAIESLAAAGEQSNIEVFVLANGCRDATIDEVRASVTIIPNLTLVEIDLADKANAWNVFVYDVVTPEPDFDTSEAHF